MNPAAAITVNNIRAEQHKRVALPQNGTVLAFSSHDEHEAQRSSEQGTPATPSIANRWARKVKAIQEESPRLSREGQVLGDGASDMVVRFFPEFSSDCAYAREGRGR